MAIEALWLFRIALRCFERRDHAMRRSRLAPYEGIYDADRMPRIERQAVPTALKRKPAPVIGIFGSQIPDCAIACPDDPLFELGPLIIIMAKPARTPNDKGKHH